MSAPGAARATASPVGAITTLSLTFTTMISQIASRGRLIAMGTLTVIALVLATIVTLSGTDEGADDAAGFVLTLGFYIIVPLVSLVIASASLGASHHDGTLVYLWLRPMGRTSITLGGWLASLVIALPFSLIATIVPVLILGGGAALTAATVLAATLATITYTTMFGLLALALRNAIAWGLAYVLVWEGLVASFGLIPARMSIRGYASSIIGAQMSDAEGVTVYPTSTVVSVVVMLAVATVSLTLSAWYLQEADIE